MGTELINTAHDLDVCDDGEASSDSGARNSNNGSRHNRIWRDRRDIVRTVCNVIATGVVVYGTLRGR
ncbi:hypothetical protein KGQ19_12795 [Catenulispora sp. NL8]|uniref:Uncharacterized protein n=1 Tax=Catenulispora pinistramenti TaxID=2705254 RepID=A0ABS5KNY2_9ACTN|nr:hypothetical protein [Catenulispora pinistramenti]MBS2547745.1 hypothetical protein [Catenulispora pinistramenti]